MAESNQSYLRRVNKFWDAVFEETQLVSDSFREFVLRNMRVSDEDYTEEEAMEFVNTARGQWEKANWKKRKGGPTNWYTAHPEEQEDFDEEEDEVRPLEELFTPEELEEVKRQLKGKGRMRGCGLEGVILDKAKDYAIKNASKFADSLGGKDFFKGVGEDITDVVSGRRVGDTQRQRVADREAKQKADGEEREKKEMAYQKANPNEFSAQQYANEVKTKLYNEITPRWNEKFLTPKDGYLVFASDVDNFSGLVREKGLKSKAEVDKLYEKIKNEALQTIRTGNIVGNQKDNREDLRAYKESQARREGSGSRFHKGRQFTNSQNMRGQG